MRYALSLLALTLALSCAEPTRPTAFLEYLRCPSSPPVEGGSDTGLSSSDRGLFGSTSKSSPYNCINDPSICSMLGGSFVCDTAQGCCQPMPQGYCTKSTDCTTAEKPVCNLSANICVACSTGAMQTQGNQQCADWVATQSDPLNRNLCISGLCGECLTNADCTRAGKTFCNQTTNICGGCTKSSDCPGSNICKVDSSLLATGDDLTKIGECVAASDVAFVDISYINCSTGDGTQAKPFCQIDKALMQAKSPSYINVVGRGDAVVRMYQPVTVATSGQRVAILGPGRDVMPFTSAQAVLSGVTVTGGAQVTLMNLAVANNAGPPAVQCMGSGTLYVNNVLIANSSLRPKGGIYASNCTALSVEKTKINYADGYGIYIVGGSGHRVVNNVIINGGSVADPTGMRISGGATGLFAFNTIANNRQGGVLCDNAVPVSDSILMVNGADPQVLGICQPMRIVTGGVTLDASYMNLTMTGEPGLTADPQSRAIDQGQPDANQTIKDDYYGNPRPQGKGYDVGFQEVR